MSLIERAKKILLTPQTEWPVIDGEQTTTGELYSGYIIRLAALGPVAQIIGLSVVGIGMGSLGSFRFPFGYALRIAVVSYAGTLIGVFVVGLIIDALAPTFEGQKNQMQALKVTAYSCTAFWLAGVLALLPSLAILMLLGFVYTIYLLYLGLPELMKAPQDKAALYAGVVALCMMVLWFVIFKISRQFYYAPAAAGI